MTTPKKTPKKKQPNTKQQPQKERKIPWLPIIFGVVAIALIGAIVFSGDEAIGSEFGEVTVTGEALPLFASAETDTAIGLVAPEVVGENFSGDTVTIEHDGTPKAVVFLAHWCPHCQSEVPRVQEWLDAGGGVPGVEVVSVATSMNSAQPNYPSSEWLEREDWTVPVIADDSDDTVHFSYGSGGFPYWVFLNGDGSVARRSSGELDIATLEAFMQEIAP